MNRIQPTISRVLGCQKRRPNLRFVNVEKENSKGRVQRGAVRYNPVWQSVVAVSVAPAPSKALNLNC